MSIDTSQTSSSYRVGYVGRGGYSLQETIHSSYNNQGIRVYVEGRVGIGLRRAKITFITKATMLDF